MYSVIAPGRTTKVIFVLYLSALTLNNFKMVGFVFSYHQLPKEKKTSRKCWDWTHVILLCKWPFLPLYHGYSGMYGKEVKPRKSKLLLEDVVIEVKSICSLNWAAVQSIAWKPTSLKPNGSTMIDISGPVSEMFGSWPFWWDEDASAKDYVPTIFQPKHPITLLKLSSVRLSKFLLGKGSTSLTKLWLNK